MDRFRLRLISTRPVGATKAECGRADKLADKLADKVGEAIPPSGGGGLMGYFFGHHKCQYS
jgi:hypothetical protein